MLAKIKAGTTSGEVVFITEKDFANNLSKKHGDRIFEVHQEAIHWAKNVGRLHSYWQMNGFIYVKVVDKNDNPYDHYIPSDFGSILSLKTWVSDCCGSDNCGDSCSGGDCGSCKS